MHRIKPKGTMIEKKKAWAVTRDFEITERVVIVDEGKVLMSKKPGTNDSCYTDGWNLICSAGLRPEGRLL